MRADRSWAWGRGARVSGPISGRDRGRCSGRRGGQPAGDLVERVRVPGLVFTSMFTSKISPLIVIVGSRPGAIVQRRHRHGHGPLYAALVHLVNV